MDKEPQAEPESSAAPQAPALPQARKEPQQTPYARVGEDVGYAGPRRADVPAGPIHVVFFGPKAVEIAQSPEVRAALAAGAEKGRDWKLLPVGSDKNWSAADWKVWAASDDLIHAIMDEHALAIVALNRDAAHLAEQLSLKTFVPVVALSSDKTLTSINIPWIFCLPDGTTPAAALRLLETAVERSGPNPERLRGVLASGSEIAGVSFLPNGEPRSRN